MTTSELIELLVEMVLDSDRKNLSISDIEEDFCEKIVLNFEMAKTIEERNIRASETYIADAFSRFFSSRNADKTIEVDNLFSLDIYKNLYEDYYSELKTCFDEKKIILSEQFPENKEEYSTYNFENLIWIKNCLKYIDTQLNFYNVLSNIITRNARAPIDGIFLQYDTMVNGFNQLSENINNEFSEKNIKIDGKVDDLDKKANDLDKKANDLDKKADDLDKKADDLDKKADDLDKKADELEEKGEKIAKTADNLIPNMLTSLGIFISVVIAVVVVYLSDIIDMNSKTPFISVLSEITDSGVIQLFFGRYVLSAHLLGNIVFLLLFMIAKLTDRNILGSCKHYKEKDDAVKAYRMERGYCFNCKEKCGFAKKVRRKASYIVAYNLLAIVLYIVLFAWYLIA